MFALRYPLAPDWEAVVREDTRWYLNLQQDTAQPVHPMIKKLLGRPIFIYFFEIYFSSFFKAL